jgi:EAL domain-containing protein (putative c-di-GMP-specific phosphodiesterase class I)
VEALTLEIDEKTVRPTVSIAGAEIEGHEREDVESASDRALDSAFVTVQRMLQKEEFNAVALPSLSGEEGSLSAETGRILTLINEAIESQKFVLLFQPIISLRGDSDEHYEVFLRMLDRNDERMLPDQFLRTAIENGAAGKIDRWVILQSIKLLSAHRARGHNTRLTINLTCNSVTDPEFIHWLGVAVKAARLPSDAIIFQLTEQDAATYLRQTREFLEGLKSIHCRSALSRFGLTAEPFEILRQMPVEFVKLDGSHIERMMADQDYRGEVTQTIKQLQAAGKLTIVPMVENANALSALWQAGANYIQGHYLQEPSTTMDYDFSTDD